MELDVEKCSLQPENMHNDYGCCPISERGGYKT
jgi:hypothetical protein